jgi:para-nitrobenzyl esterase
MVEFHGGGFLGEFRDDDGTNLIHSGPAIYVYVGYRLGILGFLADSALGAHSGDYGLMDQPAALRWVKDNIAGFGGDSHNVTIFGESAGGASVCDQVASPTANGLFERGISISGFYNFNVNTIWSQADCKSKLQTEAQAQRVGAKFAASVGCGNASDIAACLRGFRRPRWSSTPAGTWRRPPAGRSGRSPTAPRFRCRRPRRSPRGR